MRACAAPVNEANRDIFELGRGRGNLPPSLDLAVERVVLAWAGISFASVGIGILPGR